ncbi:TorF family putative porin [Stutzerimonas marianensis]|uniref:TorF family putative porin n=1 Tax=Stutzerimonas marianensis TaxID=2929513 RepID=UPI003C2D2D2F
MDKRYLIALVIALGGCASQPEVMEREVGQFDLKLGTAPTRSMAQGLVQPATASTFRGGLDLTHESGVYVGQWSPSVGLLDGSQLELNSYVGYAQPRMDDSPGYELGVIRYSFPEIDTWDREEYYAGFNLGSSRLGGALSSALGRTDSTLFVELGSVRPFDVGVRLKYATHSVDNPLYYNGGSLRTFNDWSLSLSRQLLGVKLDLSYSDSNLQGAQCGVYSGQNAYCEGFMMFKAERAFF